MVVPANRVPVRIARGTKTALDAALTSGDLKEGEIAYANDEDKLYIVESSTLIPTQTDLGTTSIDLFTDVDISTVAPTDGQGLVWVAANSQFEPATLFANVVEDTTPQLGGDLDVQASEINTSTVNGNVKVAPNGTGALEVRGNTGNDAALQLNCEQNTHGVKIKSPPHSAGATYTLTLPNDTGTTGQALTTDGSGGLSWSTPSAVGSIDDLSDVDTTTVAPTDGQALVWDNANSQWEPGTVSGGGGATAIDDLTDVDTSTVAPTDGQVLTWDNANSQWEPATPTAAGLPAANDGEALIYENGQWVAGPVIGGVNYSSGGGDSDYNSVEVLLHFDGTNGSTTFTDNSKNSWSVSAAGAAQLSTTQSKFGGASLYCGTNTGFNAAAIADADALTLDGDFTIEAWVYNQSTPVTYSTIVSKWEVATQEYLLVIMPDNSIHFGWGPFNVNTITNPLLESAASSIAFNTWYHIAVTRSGNDFRLFIDGTQVDTATNSAAVSNFGRPLNIGAYDASAGAYRLDGYIDDVRITKGVARYTANFTAPTAAFPNTAGGTTVIPYSIDGLDDVDTSTVAPTNGQVLTWDNTAGKWEPGTFTGSGSLPPGNDGEALIWEDGAWVAGPVIGGVNYTPSGDPLFSQVYTLLYGNGTNGSDPVDSSSNSHTLTLTNSPVVDTSIKKYGSGSISLGASGYITPPAVAIDANDFTLECWVYWTTVPASFSLYESSPDGSAGSRNNAFALYYNTGTFRYYSAGTDRVTSTSNPFTNATWHHVAITRESNVVKMFIDGTQEGADYSGGPSLTTSGGVIGKGTDTATYSNSVFIDDFRLTIGTARYTANFTPPTDELPGSPTTVDIPYSIDNLDDVDTSTTPPTASQVLGWNSGTSKWEPATPSGLPAAQDGEALIYENGAWVAGPVIGGYNYNLGDSITSVYTPPTGFSGWFPEFNSADGNGIPASNVTLSNSNRTATATAVDWKNAISTTTKSSGKWYWELRPTVTDSQGDEFSGVISSFASTYPGAAGTGGISFRSTGVATNYQDAGATSHYSSVSGWTANDVLMFAIDLDNKYFWFGVNGTWQNSGAPAAGTGFMYSNWTGTPDFYVAHSLYRTNNSVDLVGYLVPGANYSLPYGINNLDDVDTSTIPPTNGDILAWDSAISKWEPAAPQGLPPGADGSALIYENGQWVVGPVIGGVNYTPTADPNYADVEVLLSMDGTDGSTTFTDSGPAANTITVSGNAAISTTQSKFGGASGDFSSGGYLYDTTGTYDLTGSAWTVESWAYFTSTPSNNHIVGTLGTADTGSTCLFYSAGVLYWQRAGTSTNELSYTWAPSLNQWYHLAVCWDGTTLRMFIDGTQVASNTVQPAHGSLGLNVGGRNSGNSFPGYLDDVRITSNVARYTANFTPPTSEFAGNPVSIPYSIDKLDDVDTSTVAPTDGDVLVYDNANTKFVPGVRVKSDTTQGGTGSSAVANIVTISQVDYDALGTPDANTIYFIV